VVAFIRRTRAASIALSLAEISYNSRLRALGIGARFRLWRVTSKRRER